MTTDRETTRIVRSWLSSDEHGSADRVLDTVLELLDTTPQRRAWGPAWRIADVNTYAKLASAVAAVVAVVVLAVLFLPRSNGVSTPGPSASAGQSAGPAASIDKTFPSEGALSAGRHTFTEAGTVFTMEVPDGWSSSGLNCSICAIDAGFLHKGADDSPTGAWMPIWPVVGVAADPCGHKEAPVATSASALADAVAGLPGVDVVTRPEDATIDGKPARHVAIRLGNKIACDAGDFYLWYAKTDAVDFRWGSIADQTNDVWVVELDGKRFWIEAETYKGSSKALADEIQAMIESIRFQ